MDLIVWVSGRFAAAMEPSACINCGRCVEVCPGRVVPRLLADYAENYNEEAFLSHDGMECCECGCCSYVCPAKRPLTQTITMKFLGSAIASPVTVTIRFISGFPSMTA